MSVQVGQKAPDFSLKTNKMQDFKLSDLQGKKNVVLLFVPLAFTGGGTKEFCSVRDNINTLQNDNTQVVGISVDSPFALDAWAAKEGYTFPLLSDFNKEVSTAYGSLYENLLGFRGIAKRSAFVIDKNGTVQYAWVSEDAGKLPELDPIRDCLQKCGGFAHGQDQTCPYLSLLGRSGFFQASAKQIVRDHEWREDVEHAAEIGIVSFGSLAGEWCRWDTSAYYSSVRLANRRP